ncbi:MAG: diguanylate cyclase [Asticcacaulis sp.]
MTSSPLFSNLQSARLHDWKILPPLIIAAAVLSACLLGIWTRPIGFLASVWPANAIMLGLLIRMPSASNPLGWAAGAAAFVAADLLTGSPLNKALILNTANLMGIAATYVVYTRFQGARAGLTEPASMFYLLIAAAAGAAAAGVVGGLANPMLFNGSMFSGFAFWFATEFVNYVTLLPVILAAPDWPTIKRRFKNAASMRTSDLPPIAALFVSLMASLIIGGPGAIAFPVPALLWCGFVYPVFATTLLTLVFGMWTMLVVSAGHAPTDTSSEMWLVSLRLGVSLIAAAPIVLACVTHSRNELIVKLQHLALHDPLTGISNRKAFRDKAQLLLDSSRQSCALLMFDLDHFKTINDTHGHAAGDRVLVSFSERSKGCLRPNDLLGRLGGEEFAVMIFNCTQAQALALAERIRLAVREPLVLEDGTTLAVTTSVGISVVNSAKDASDLDAILSNADAMLYRAKNNGRDRAVVSVMVPA